MVFMKYHSINEKGTMINTNAGEHVDYGIEIEDVFDLQEIDTGIYMSKLLWYPFGNIGIYGGVMISQALMAGFRTVPENFFAHSLHSYFVLPTSIDIPVIYKVERVRDGRSYATRSVTATQNNKVVFMCSCSFSKEESDDVYLKHQSEMPKVIDAESTISRKEYIEVKLSSSDIPEDVQNSLKEYKGRIIDVFVKEFLIDCRDLEYCTIEEVLLGPKPNQIDRRWLKAKGSLSKGHRIHACVIAFASDCELLQTALKANGMSYHLGNFKIITSLSHSIWFHSQTKADGWLLYDMNSPRSNHGRAISFGKMYTQDGCLVATTAQEGVIRISEKEKERRRKQAQSESQIKFNHRENSKL